MDDILFVPAPAPSDAQSSLLISTVLLIAATSIASTVALQDPIEFQMRKPLAGFPSSCACWNFQAPGWSSDNIIMTQQNFTHSSCQTKYLGFCAVVTIVPVVPQTITVISYIGCAVFMLCSLAAVVSYAIFLNIRSEKLGKISFNVYLSMLLLNIFFIVVTRWNLCNTAGCTALMLIFHYFLAASFLWLTIEIFNLYQMIMKVFVSYENFYILKRTLFAWGLPVIVVAITIAIDVSSYEDASLYCRTPVQNPKVFYTCFLGFICLMSLVSFIFFFLISIAVSRSDSSSDPRISPDQLFVTLVIIVLFSVSWIVGLFAMKNGGVALEVVFCIVNSLCGLAIFSGRCLLSDDMKAAWIDCSAGARWHRAGTTLTTPGVTSRWSDAHIFARHPVVKKTNNAWNPSPATREHEDIQYIRKSSPERKSVERHPPSIKYGRPNVSYSNTLEPPRKNSLIEDNLNLFDINTKSLYEDKLTYI